MDNTPDARLALIREIMCPHAGQQLESTERYMRDHPEKYSAFHGAIADIESMRARLESNADVQLVDNLISAAFCFASELAMETYLRGLLDGGILHHALSTGELPPTQNPNKI